MRAAGLAFSLLVAGAVSGAEGELDRSVLRVRAMERMRQALDRLHDYTCTQTLTREIGNGTPLHIDAIERLRLQVAYIGGKELFAWPDGGSFERSDPSELVGGGLSGTGDFAEFSRAVFDGYAAEFASAVDEIREGKPVVRYDFRVPLQKSGYLLQSKGERAVVDYHGSWWVDPVSERVLTLEVHVDDRVNNIPDRLDMSEVKTVLEYRYDTVGGVLFPFPGSSTLTVAHKRSSVVTRNRIAFSDCRQYAARSTVRFGEEPTPDTGGSPAPSVREFPNDLRIEVELDEPVDALSSAAGDRISATVRESVNAGGFRISKGATLTGRILRFEIDPDRNTTHVRLGWSHLESGGSRFPFRARYAGSPLVRGVIAGAPRPSRWMNLRELLNAGSPEWTCAADFVISGKDGRIPAGFRIRWVTAAR